MATVSGVHCESFKQVTETWFKLFFYSGFNFKDMRISGADIQLIEKQLGRKPRGLLRVIKRCNGGYPKVILNSPVLDDGTPFPTIFWLTCPFLVKEISRLEGKGWIKHLQTQLAKDSFFKLKLEEAHDDYRQRRASLMSSQGAERNGIGGASNSEGLKCLHAHYAHYLATGCNPVGELVDEHIGEIGECDICGKWIDEISID